MEDKGRIDMNCPTVEMRNIVKMFGTFKANDGINLTVHKGEIHAILGENGAGKSTLMNILYGLYHPTSGQILINGKKVSISGPNKAIKLGIGMVHQHFMLVQPFTVTENIILGLEPMLPLGMVNMKAARKIEELVQIMHNLAREGKSIILITHKLKEIKEAADYCTIIRQGKYIDTVKVADTTEQQLASMMVGRNVEFKVDKADIERGDVALEVHDLHARDYRDVEVLRGLDLKVSKGEIVGIAGIDGNGQTELVEILTGLKKATSGTITMNGHDAYNKTPRQLFDMGISSIPADRHKHGLVLDFSVEDNLLLQNIGEKPFSSHGVINQKAIDEHASELIEKYDIRPRGCEHENAGDLSGGNQQKVIIAREVTNDKDLLIAVNPTRGLDVGAIEYVHKYIVDQRNKHKAVMLVSFELDEVMSLSDRIDVIFEGRIVGSVKGGEADEKQLGLMMAGGGTAHEQ